MGQGTATRTLGTVVDLSAKREAAFEARLDFIQDELRTLARDRLVPTHRLIGRLVGIAGVLLAELEGTEPRAVEHQLDAEAYIVRKHLELRASRAARRHFGSDASDELLALVHSGAQQDAGNKTSGR